jgi:hypothetical protein
MGRLAEAFDAWHQGYMTSPRPSIAADIRPPGALGPAWFTQVLQAAGVEAVVANVTAQPVGTGQIGDSIRFTLTYRYGAGVAPASLVGKFPAEHPKSFEAGVAAGSYVREVMFYRTLATTAGVATPRCLVAEIDEHSGRFVLLFEDLAPARQGDQLAGVSLEQAELVVDQAAMLHASHWGDEGLEVVPWLIASRAAAPTLLSKDRVGDYWRGYSERYRDRLSPRTLEASRRLAERIERLEALGGPRCLVHNDFRSDNMMFATAEGGRPITILDWQSVGLGAGPNDLGYFLAGALPPDQRRASEAALLERYHRRLTTAGVKGYDAAQLRRDYAVGGLRLLMVSFVSSMRVKQTPRGDDMFMQMAHAATEHIFDNGALDLLA